MISAKVICDSISPQQKRLTTFELRYPKFIHGEFMTHRVISRNASSSRAIPVAKLIQEVRDDATRAAPVYWGAEQKGMQSGEELTGENLIMAKAEWREAAFQAALSAEIMIRRGVHKSIVNRLLEPFSHINVVATATEWDNFFGLRLDAAAEPTMRALAVAMWQAYNESTPCLLQPGQWHVPYTDESDIETIKRERWLINGPTGDPVTDGLIKISVGRTARVSYNDFETNARSTIESNLGLHDRLLGAQPLHASPAEHQATPDEEAFNLSINGRRDFVSNRRYLWGNLIAWCQYRKMLPYEACAPLPEQYAKREV